MSAVGGSEDAGGEADTERELRQLLERFVPRSAAPAGRMRRVRQLAWRRRRRLGVGLAGLAGGLAAAVAMAVLGHTPSAAPGGLAEYQPPGASPSADGTLFRYPGFHGLTVRLPGGWSTRVLHARQGREPVSVAATRPMTVARVPCPDVRRHCLAPSALGTGEGLIVFRLGSGHPLWKAGKSGGQNGGRARLMDTGLGRFCRGAGGTRELTGGRVVGRWAGGDELVLASACLNRPSAVTLGQVRAVLGTVSFSAR